MQSAPAEPAASAPAANPAINLTPAEITERARTFVAHSGVDPDSENGQILVAWFVGVAQNPDYFARLRSLRGKSTTGTEMTLSPADRLRFVHLMKDIASESRNGCEMSQLTGRDLTSLAKTSSPKMLRSVFELMDIVVGRNGAAPADGEHYTVAELLEVDARIDAIDVPPSLAKQDKSSTCALIQFAVDALDGLPEPEQRRATYELFKLVADGKLAAETVLADPAAYLDEVFDERRLPDAMRSQLPPDGSRPLPYSRLVVDGAWVSRKATPKAERPYVDTYINRRNNGVVVELMTTKDASGNPRWSSFDMGYGLADLLSQSVSAPRHATVLRTLNDLSAIALASQPLTEGKRVEIALPQPSSHGQLTQRCEIGKTEPASTVFGTLTGNAVNLDCSEVHKDGKTVRVRSAWLLDYGIELTRSIDDEDGTTDVVIKNVTIVKP
ncbi:hypothetical protein HT746_22205 [Burkholderia pyrrocinia]|uniref:hypothetical protein n=1 Tax=Burkholderia pyrrocinia TaxID=60550 RepID=UPI001575F296|nr:hypothetical protein [Burkholderia pyrrocinia]NTX29801.1 hypothetical protein [Burkholderia pyrrocinia]